MFLSSVLEGLLFRIPNFNFNIRSAYLVLLALQLEACSVNQILKPSGDSSSAKNDEAIIVDDKDKGDDSLDTVSEPISVAGGFLSFQCYRNPNSVANFRNQLIQCMFLDEQGLPQRITIADDLAVSGIDQESLLVKDSLIKDFQWDVWIKSDADLRDVSFLGKLRQELGNKASSARSDIKEMPQEILDLIDGEYQAELENSDNLLLVPTLPAPVYSQLSGFFIPGEPNDDDNEESCVTYMIVQPTAINGASEIRKGWNDEKCDGEGIPDYSFACQNLKNSADWILSNEISNPISLGKERDPCPIGYRWSYPSSADQVETIRMALEETIDASAENGQVWFNLEIVNQGEGQMKAIQPNFLR